MFKCQPGLAFSNFRGAQGVFLQRVCGICTGVGGLLRLKSVLAHVLVAGFGAGGPLQGYCIAACFSEVEVNSCPG